MASSTFHADMLLSGAHISKEQGTMSFTSTDGQAHFANFRRFQMLLIMLK